MCFNQPGFLYCWSVMSMTSSSIQLRYFFVLSLIMLKLHVGVISKQALNILRQLSHELVV